MCENARTLHSVEIQRGPHVRDFHFLARKFKRFYCSEEVHFCMYRQSRFQNTGNTFTFLTPVARNVIFGLFKNRIFTMLRFSCSHGNFEFNMYEQQRPHSPRVGLNLPMSIQSSILKRCDDTDFPW